MHENRSMPMWLERLWSNHVFISEMTLYLVFGNNDTCNKSCIFVVMEARLSVLEALPHFPAVLNPPQTRVSH